MGDHLLAVSHASKFRGELYMKRSKRPNSESDSEEQKSGSVSLKLNVCVRHKKKYAGKKNERNARAYFR